MNIKHKSLTAPPKLSWWVTLCLIIGIVLYSSGHCEEYERSEFGGWADLDKNGLSSREDALIEKDKCDNIPNTWYLPYTGILTFDSSIIDIDHIVPLKHAYLSGANKWTARRKVQFANDPLNLETTYRSTNRSKGSRSPDQWMPPNKSYHCTYLYRWVFIKEKYDLSFSEKESSFVFGGLERCIEDQLIR
jgi:hypothetical protein